MLTRRAFDIKYRQLNPKQREAVDAIYGPVMVVAGPGTGKTTVLTLRIANIIAKTDARPEEILALTFTENGVRNMREKLREVIGDVAFRVNIFTFHAFANYMKSIFPENFEKIGERAPMDESEKLRVLESILEAQSFSELRTNKYGLSLRSISKRISELKMELIYPNDLEKIVKREKQKISEWEKGIKQRNKTKEKEKENMIKHLSRLEELCHLYRLYEKELLSKELFDYDDAILEFLKALRSNPNMAYEMREGFQFVLADEHQDANGAQNEILRMFKAEGVEYPNIFVVGDDKQSIFRFQGASLEHFYNFSHEFKGAKIISLKENYRSHRRILEVSHSLIASDGREHQRLSPNVQYEEKDLEITEYSKYDIELADTANKVKRLIASRAKSEIAIIARNNKALFDIAQYLEAEGIEYSIDGELSLFENAEYRRFMYLLLALSNPFEGALLKALYAGYFRADISSVISMANEAKSKRSDFATLYLSSAEGAKVKELIAIAKKMEVAEFLRHLQGEIFINLLPTDLEALRSIFDESRKLIRRNRAAKLDDLLSHLNFLEKHDLAPLNSHDKEARVRLLSIHKAKGLEFDYVFIINVTANSFEKSRGRSDMLHIPGIGSDTDIDEERRLLYVALTRAKRHASLSYALTTADGGNATPSILLTEIDESLVQKKKFANTNIYTDLLKVTSHTKGKTLFRDIFLSRNFSVSSLNNYLECPWKYFFRNLLLLPEPAAFAASLGNSCHNALRVFHINAKKGKILSKNELEKLVDRCVFAEPFSKAELPVARKKARDSIFAYAKSFVPFNKFEKIFIEDSVSFTFNLKDKKANFDIVITGKIDLYREMAGAITVVDFKTKKRMTRNEILGQTKNSDGNEMRQLQFYKFLIENIQKGAQVKLGTLTFLTPERGRILSETFELLERDKEQIERALSQALLSIYHLDFWNDTCGNSDCEYCLLSKSIKG